MEPDALPPLSVCLVGTGHADRLDRLALLAAPGIHVSRLETMDGDTDAAPRAPDVILLDGGSDSATLLESLSHARRRWQVAAILCVGANSPAEAVALLEAGADDVTMRDTPVELEAALIAAACRRVRAANERVRLVYGDIVYDRSSHRVWCAGSEIALTPREFRLFDILFQRAGRAVSADTLQDFVWNDAPPATSNSLAVYVGYLRRKLSGSRSSMLETLRGSGYRLARRDRQG